MIIYDSKLSSLLKVLKLSSDSLCCKTALFITDLYEARTPLAPACIKLSAHMKHTNNSTYMKKLKTSNQTAINSLPGKSAFVIDRDRLTKFLEEVKDDMVINPLTT